MTFDHRGTAGRTDRPSEDGLVVADRLLERLPALLKYAARKAVLPAFEDGLSRLIQTELEAQREAAEARLRAEVDKIRWDCREEVVRYIMPRFFADVAWIEALQGKPDSRQSRVERKLRAPIESALLLVLVSALPDTSRDGNAALVTAVVDLTMEE